MECSLEINSNGGFKREHVESFTLTTKSILSPLRQFLWLPDVTGWQLAIKGSHSRSLVKSLDKLKTLYLHYQSAYGHQAWQDINTPLWVPTHKVT